jgi:hypothetical protein
MSATVRAFILIPVLLLVAAITAVASASSGNELSTGRVVKWSGTAPGFGIIGWNEMEVSSGREPDCAAPTCAMKDIEVTGRGDLFVSAMDLARSGQAEVIVFAPNGTFERSVSAPGRVAVVKLAHAAKGRYTVQVQTNQRIEEGGRFKASALLKPSV